MFDFALGHGRRVLVLGSVDFFTSGVSSLEWSVGDGLVTFWVVVFRVGELNVSSYIDLGNFLAWTFFRRALDIGVSF